MKKKFARYLLQFSLLTLTLAACGPGRKTIQDSGLASVQINELATDGFDSYQFGMKPSASDGTVLNPQTYQRGAKTIEAKVKPGEYTILLDYYKGGKKVYSADYCVDAPAEFNKVRTLIPGPNNLKILVCDTQGTAPTSDVTIDPVLQGKTAATELDKACTPAVEFHADEAQGAGILTRQFSDTNAMMKDAAHKVCTLLYRQVAEVPRITKISLTIKDMDGVAYTAGSDVSFSGNYIQIFAQSHSEAEVKSELMGAIIHEFTHIYQKSAGSPSWEIEGMADFVRHQAGYVSNSKRYKGGSYTDSYNTTAFFFVYLNGKYKDFAYRLNLAASAWPAGDMAFVELTGKTVDVLWAEYQSSL
jgi:hypothetical protein